MSNDFPSSKFERGTRIAKTGLKVGTNYAKRYLRKKSGKEDDSGDGNFHAENAKQVFQEFTKLRGTALKIAQGMSMDQGFLPEEFAEVMSQAQYSVPPINKALVRSIIKRELGKYPEQLFASFESEAFAAASIGQVHKAELKDGRKVAIKIQYPNVRETIDSDLGLAKILMKRIVKKGADIDPYFDEVKQTLLDETDYQKEGKQIDLFRERFGGLNIVIPEWVEEYSTDKVLCMTYLEGRHLGEFLKEDPSQEQRNHFGQLLWDFFHEQIKDMDFVHADTHPGNFLFTYDDKLGVIDFGCVKKFPEEFFMNYLRLLPTHLADDEEAIRELYKKLNVIKPNADNPEHEERYFNFARNYGMTFAEPYKHEFFDFGDKDYRNSIKHYTKDAPIGNEPRGSQHFLYTTRVHLGLYNLLMKMGAHIDTSKSKEILSDMLDVNFGELKEAG
ncbi:ABC1 kinase family protein [Gracilimonas mengyeensis]|uniref:Phosphotransferase enzyme family protein n=1 Tax=Gracilimonas mengyeensis TaxID=1302730 RepID=A0A521B4T3_9BACT|nr:AarF/ABC1/UbiB kinase family protein [Gracilimonas mengyeensis]SMO42051.1 Phosphotransferase enzyme family protein [Gracilimonas mengyeensis]